MQKSHRNHYNMFFNENENHDVKMIIPSNTESHIPVENQSK